MIAPERSSTRPTLATSSNIAALNGRCSFNSSVRCATARSIEARRKARWTKKHGKSYFGFRLSSRVDRRHKLIRRVHISTASENDTLHFERVLDASNTNRDIYADKGYVDGEREQRLRAQRWRVHIQRKGQAGKPLSDCQERRNKRIAKVRARVEHVFAGLEQRGGKALRSIGLARATLHLNWKAATYNLRRLCSLKEAGPTPFCPPKRARIGRKRADLGAGGRKNRPTTLRGGCESVGLRGRHDRFSSDGQ